ncbi:hypothetical protein [Polaribacter ponticola]|uniref:Uncharacterized protein n=1 Tax=Polaribacter ponticola TaxID=2978475 RepID=A0ABT5S4A4_9FLAO|nr:hypothetical protein [Polaribacter sp. MSW5]MDD7912940.1 hypothetical protein [Polaribacter sp. MSW5]
MSQSTDATAVAPTNSLICLTESKVEATKSILQFAIQLYEEQFTEQLFLTKDYDAYMALSKKCTPKTFFY